jgi:ribokinase
MCDALRAAGVRVDGTVTTVDGVATGTAVVLLQPEKGENSIVIVGGANTAKWEWPQAATDALEDADAVLLQCEVKETTNVEAVRRCAKAGVAVTLDVGGAEGPLLPEILQGVSTISPNETELARLVGWKTSEIDSRDKVIAAARKLQSQCGKCDVLVKRGKNGSLFLSGALQG